MIPTARMREDAKTAMLADCAKVLMFTAPDRRIVAYPCSSWAFLPVGDLGCLCSNVVTNCIDESSHLVLTFLIYSQVMPKWINLSKYGIFQLHHFQLAPKGVGSVSQAYHSRWHG
jgi:hypothetical protein